MEDSPEEVQISDFADCKDPSEAKYVKFSFDVTSSGRISGLGIYPTASLVVARTAVDGGHIRDFAGGKEAREVAEAPPEEGPPPFLPDPLLFVFVPILCP